MTLDTFGYLWDGSDQGWTLIRLIGQQTPVIYNRTTRTALTIEDDQLYADVVRKMIDEGVAVLDKLP
jgi:hypothetical protein